MIRSMPFVCVLLVPLIPLTAHAQQAELRATVGAYYFDGWTGQTNHITELLKTEFADRKPVWGWKDDTVEIIEKQIDCCADHGPTRDTYANNKSLRHRKEHDRENSIGVGGWRIELSPKDRPVATNFLVVLQAADQATESMVPVEGIARPGQMGAKVTVGTTGYEVTFATEGPAGGHIRVTQGSKITLDRPVASGVEDNYQKWAEDPRYEIWMTRPEYRNFFGERRDREKGASP